MCRPDDSRFFVVFLSKSNVWKAEGLVTQHISPYPTRSSDLPESPQTSERAQMARALFPSTKGIQGENFPLGLGGHWGVGECPRCFSNLQTLTGFLSHFCFSMFQRLGKDKNPFSRPFEDSSRSKRGLQAGEKNSMAQALNRLIRSAQVGFVKSQPRGFFEKVLALKVRSSVGWCR